MSFFSDQALNVVMSDERLTKGARTFFYELVRLARRQLTWWKMSHAFMQGLMKASRSTVMRYIRDLEAFGYLAKRGNAAVTRGFKHRLANSYRLVPQVARMPRRQRAIIQEALKYLKAANALKQRAHALCVKMNLWESDSKNSGLDLGNQSAKAALKQMREERRRGEIL